WDGAAIADFRQRLGNTHQAGLREITQNTDQSRNDRGAALRDANHGLVPNERIVACQFFQIMLKITVRDRRLGDGAVHGHRFPTLIAMAVWADRDGTRYFLLTKRTGL